MAESTVLLFAGESARNQQWLKALVLAVEERGFSNLLPWTYAHWLSGGASISIADEVSAFKNSMDTRPESTFIVSKSAGTAIVKQLIEDGFVAPKKMVFIGVPVQWARAQEIDLLSWLASLQIPTLILQNEHDPACEVSILREALKDNVLIELVPLSGVGHSYDDFGTLAESIHGFLRQ